MARGGVLSIAKGSVREAMRSLEECRLLLGAACTRGAQGSTAVHSSCRSAMSHCPNRALLSAGTSFQGVKT